MRRESILLFSDYDLYAVLEAQGANISERVGEIPEQKILQEETETLIASLEKELEVEPIKLQVEDIEVEQSEVKVDVRYDNQRAIFDRSRPFYIDDANQE